MFHWIAPTENWSLTFLYIKPNEAGYTIPYSGSVHYCYFCRCLIITSYYKLVVLWESQSVQESKRHATLSWVSCVCSASKLRDWDFSCIRFPLYLKAFFPFYSLPSWPLTKVHQHHRISAILIIIVINITIFSLFSLCHSKTLYTVYDYCCHQHNWRKKEKKVKLLFDHLQQRYDIVITF